MKGCFDFPNEWKGSKENLSLKLKILELYFSPRLLEALSTNVEAVNIEMGPLWCLG